MQKTCLLRTFACLFLGSAGLGAQVVIVDSAGGPGHQFTDLPAAVAAVPSGSFLYLRAGTYTGFTCRGKALHIRGTGVTTCTISSATIDVDQVPQGEFFSMADLSVDWGANPVLLFKGGTYHLRDVTVRSNFMAMGGGDQGVVVVRDATLFASHLQVFPTSIPLLSSPLAGLFCWNAKMTLNQCVIEGADSTDSGVLAGAGLAITGASVVETFDSSFRGGHGFSSQNPLFYTPGHGGDGAAVSSGGMLFIYRGSFTGGNAGIVKSVLSRPQYGNAGYGINAIYRCSVGGDGGICSSGTYMPSTSWPAFGGKGVVRFTNSNQSRPHLTLDRQAISPDRYKLTVFTRIGTPCQLMVSSQSLWAPLGQLGLVGTLLINPLASDFTFLGTYTGPTSIYLKNLPPALHYHPLWFQLISPPMGSQTITSNAVMFMYRP